MKQMQHSTAHVKGTFLLLFKLKLWYEFQRVDYQRVIMQQQHKRINKIKSHARVKTNGESQEHLFEE